MPKGERLQSIDRVRGLIMVIMAVDHVRDMLGPRADPMDLDRTTVPLYLTRLVTHLCAPGFVLLAGTGAALMRRPVGEVSKFLVTRGLWLVVVEVTVVKLAWTFQLDLNVILQVIWAIGWSMVALAALVWLPKVAIATFAVAMIGLHNLFDGAHVASLLSPQAHARDWLVSILHEHNFPVLYPLIPWVGVMALGYAIGPLFAPPKRVRNLVLLGLACCALFVALRGLHLYGDTTRPIDPAHPVMSFFRTQKYPPSLHYLLMTLGPIFLMLAAAERIRAPALVVFGRVPFFFYVLHLYLIHALAVVIGAMTGFPAAAFFAPWPRFPGGFGLGLGATWAVWALVIVALYPLCRWFAQVKATRRDWWLSYV